MSAGRYRCRPAFAVIFQLATILFPELKHIVVSTYSEEQLFYGDDGTGAFNSSAEEFFFGPGNLIAMEYYRIGRSE